MDEADVSTPEGFRSAMLAKLEEWLPGGYGQDPRVTVYNVATGINYLTADVHDTDGMHLKSFRCTLLVTEIPPGVSEMTWNGQEMPIDLVPDSEVVYADSTAPVGRSASRIPVINAATAVKGWRRLEALRGSNQLEWERVWPRFLALCLKLPGAELQKLPPALYQVMVDYQECRGRGGG